MAQTTKSKEYFAESEYGVKASPRVTLARSNLKRGGGREQIGKPYKVKGRWYHPKEVAAYSKVGKASWYGDAFHGRLTANGEIYDMTHLTAAHPTLPLPSYARVTNLDNGNSVVVRINDRGPFAHGRIIDLSRRAAELLDYTRQGVAEVKVDYIGRAPLHGQDDAYLMASYRNGRDGPSDGLPEGVLIAMNGSTPENGVKRSPFATADGTAARLPEYGPILQQRPDIPGTLAEADRVGQVFAYAGAQRNAAATALDRLAANPLTAGAIVDSWNRQRSGQAGERTVFVGSFDRKSEAGNLARDLASFGRAEIESADHGGQTLHLLTIRAPQGMESGLLEKLWAAGATDAFLIRD